MSFKFTKTPKKYRLKEELNVSLEDIFRQTGDSVEAATEVLKQSKGMDKDTINDSMSFSIVTDIMRTITDLVEQNKISRRSIDGKGFDC